MAEYIERDDALMNMMHKFHCYAEGGCNHPMYEHALDAIQEIYAEDAVPVVRCKDCKHGEVDDPEFPSQYLCNYDGCAWNNAEHFCSYGERKDGE